MARTLMIPALAMLLACESQAAVQSETSTAEPSPEKATTETAGDQTAESQGRHFGDPLAGDVPTVALKDVLNNPDTYQGKTVQTSGTIDTVCQKRGCWMELRTESGQAVFIPMAGHSFFLPKDIAGRRATVQGTVGMRERSKAKKEHLRAEGAEAVAQALQIEASGVVVH